MKLFAERLVNNTINQIAYNIHFVLKDATALIIAHQVTLIACVIKNSVTNEKCYSYYIDKYAGPF